MTIVPFPISGRTPRQGQSLLGGSPSVCGPALRGACGNPGTPSFCSGWLTIILGAAQHEPETTKCLSTETKCLEYARECARRAKLVTDPELRERLFNFSRRWTERATREPSSSSAESQRISSEHPT